MSTNGFRCGFLTEEWQLSNATTFGDLDGHDDSDMSVILDPTVVMTQYYLLLFRVSLNKGKIPEERGEDTVPI